MAEEKSLIKHPSAFLPLLMSLAAIVLLVGYIAFVGVSQTPAKDEGTAAHIFQLLMGGQVLVIAYFGIKYFRKHPSQTMFIIATQIAAAVVPFVALFFFEHGV
jgi:hypothetical protein